MKRSFICLATIVCLSFLSANLKLVKGYSGDVITAYFSDTPISWNGFVTGDEWSGHNATVFISADELGTNVFLIKYDAKNTNLYACLYVKSDDTPEDYDFAYLYLDMDHDDGDEPDADDYMFVIGRYGLLYDLAYNDRTEEWDESLNYTTEWTAYYASLEDNWGAMWVIPMAVSDNQRIGIAVRQFDYSAESLSDFPIAMHPFMPSAWAEVVFQKLPSSIGISPSPASVTYGETVGLSASIDQTVSRGTVTFQYKEEEGDWTDIADGTPVDGKLSHRWTPPSAGSYSIRSIWTGDIVYRGSTSEAITITVKKASSSASTSLSSATITYKENVTVTTSIAPAISEGTLISEYSQDKLTWIEIGSGTPSDGLYSASWTPQSAGTYYIRASWTGTKNYDSSTSAEQTLTVNKVATSLQLSASPETVQIDPLTRGGASSQISGNITPKLEGIAITVTYTKPDGTTTTKTLTTTSAGQFTDALTPNQTGAWSVKASWPGDANYLAGSSSTVTVNVGENWTIYIAVAGIVIVIIVAAIARKMR